MITQNIAYLDEGLGRLLQQFKSKPRIASLLKAWLTEVQGVEDAMWDVFVQRLLATATNDDDLLDKLGQIVGQGREGLANAQFRLLISARILANRSSGRRDELLAITKILVPSTTIFFQIYSQKTIVVAPLGPVPLPPQLIQNSFLSHAKAAGDRLNFIATQQPLANTLLFGYSTETPPPPTSGQSLGWSGDAAIGGLSAYDYTTYGGSA